MEQERKKRNPAWQRDELILALDLYFNIKPSEIDSGSSKVIELSRILNKLPIHEDRVDLERFRNPNGVAMKLSNFRRFDPNYSGKGLERGGKMEKDIWNEFAQNREYLKQITKNIIEKMESISDSSTNQNGDEDELEFPEGKVLYRVHRQRERNRKLIAQVKKEALNKGELHCQVCGFDFYKTYGEIGKEYIECHHTIPVSSYQINQTTKIKDLVLVCSNCHRMLHRRRPWLNIADLKLILKKYI